MGWCPHLLAMFFFVQRWCEGGCIADQRLAELEANTPVGDAG